MKTLNPHSVTLPFVHYALTGSPLLSDEVFFMSRYLLNKEKCKLQSVTWAKNNPERTKEINRKSKLKNIEKIKITQKEYRDKNKEKIALSAKLWRIKNPDKQRISKKKSEKKRVQNDEVYALKISVSKSIYKSIIKKGNRKNKTTEMILGCDSIKFKNYIESKFESWMNWDNRGKYNGEFNYGWDLDHIIPISSAKNEQDVIKLNHYSNFQPLCSKINRDIKKNKIYA